MKSLNRCYLDSNVLVYLKDENSPHHPATRQLLKSLSPDRYTLYISSLTIDEFIHAAQFIIKQRKIVHENRYQILDKQLRTIIYLTNLNIVNPTTDKDENMLIVSTMREYNLSPRDAYHFLIMKEQGIEYFATFDKDFDKVFRSGEIRPIK